MASSKDDLSKVAGPESMAKPEPPTSSSNAQSSANPPSENAAPKKKKHRGGKNRKKNKRQTHNGPGEGMEEVREDERLEVPAQPVPFYRLQSGNRSNGSLESEALLDHRESSFARPRRQSLQQSGFTRPSLPYARHRASTSGTPPGGQRGSMTSGLSYGVQRSKLAQSQENAIEEDEAEDHPTDRTPLLSAASRTQSRPKLSRQSSGHYGSQHRVRRSSVHSKASSRSRRRVDFHSSLQPYVEDDDYDVNNPPSVPGSPQLGSLDDVMVHDFPPGSPERGREAIIDIEDDDRRYSDSPDALRRRPTVADLAERDVCFPGDAEMSEMAEDDRHSTSGSARLGRRRTRTKNWPDLSILEEWSREEKEERTNQDVRAKKITEPVFVGGRLRPGKTTWHREEEEQPFRFTYFNELFDSTIHARTISDLCQEGTTFKDLFLPDPVELREDSDDDEDDNALERPVHTHSSIHSTNGRVLGDHQSKNLVAQSETIRSSTPSRTQTRSNTPSGQNSQTATPRHYQRPKRYGPRPTFWLDVLQPTEMEMKVLAKAFGIHQLTTEDILMEEQREKVELFQSYYFLNYRSFEQDKESEDYMDPVNFYVVVFRDGVITFHHSQTPHPANVRRRIRQLNDYMSPTADWISYAIIDDVTDVYAPRVSQIEEEVDGIDEEILYLHVNSADVAEGNTEQNKPKNPEEESEKKGGLLSWFSKSNDEDEKGENDKVTGQSGGDMLRRVGECRKRVMGLYRLLGNKADVIKGFAKRCNENWEVAPRSEIGLYLGDIQDHIVTMNNNLAHYENLLSRAHSNYVAQINIRMNERAEQNADILGKLTVVGTIVLPMNIICGMWGMNVYVPGQDYDHDLTWFWWITAGLVVFAVGCFFIARKLYGIV